jgi:hypothetical protein
MQWVGGSFGLAVMTAVFGATMASLGDAVSPAEAFARGASAALGVGVVLAIGVIGIAAGVITRRSPAAVGAQQAAAGPESTAA